MHSETTAPTGGSEAAGAAGARGDRGGEEATPAGTSGSQPAPERAGEPGGDATDARGSTLPAADDNRGAGGGAEGARNTPPNRTRIPRADFIRAVKECKGNLALTGRVLGIDESTVRDRVGRIPELNALYGNRSEDATVPPPPNEGETMLRSPDQLSSPIPAADLGQMVKVTEKLLGGGFEQLGVPKATINKLRDLSALRIDAGAMLAVSLQDTHQLYYLQLLALSARADEIHKKYLDTENPEIQAMDPMARMFWQRAHTEIVEQLGKGYDRMMAGTQAMIAMMKGAKNKNAAPQRSEAGWDSQVPKSVAKSARSE